MENYNSTCPHCGQYKRQDLCDTCKKDITKIESRIFLSCRYEEDSNRVDYLFCNKKCLLKFIEENNESDYSDLREIECTDKICCETVDDLKYYMRSKEENIPVDFGNLANILEQKCNILYETCNDEIETVKNKLNRVINEIKAEKLKILKGK